MPVQEDITGSPGWEQEDKGEVGSTAVHALSQTEPRIGLFSPPFRLMHYGVS